MHITALLIAGFLGGVVEDYPRRLDSGQLNQATLDAEGYGEKKSLKREDDGLRITLNAGEPEAGWKTPQALRVGGNFSITADVFIKKLPKPAQEDGAAIGLAIAFQDVNQPDLTLLRVKEPGGAEVYRPVDKGLVDPTQPQMPQMQMMMGMGMGQPPQPPKPPRRTFPASGESIRLELHREGNNARLRAVDLATGRTRYLGQVYIGPNDVAAVKVFASNRNGVEPVDVLVREVAIRADRLTGLGTAIRTVRDTVTYGEPTAIEGNLLVVGGTPKTPPPGSSPPSATPTPQPAAATPAPAPPAAPAMAAVAVAKGQVVVVAPAAPAPPFVPANVVAAAPLSAPGTAPAPAQQPTPPAGQAPAATPPTQTPKAKIPLDEVESIRFERTPAMAGRFVGQSNYDFTMPHPTAKKDEPKKPEDKKDGPKKPEAKQDEPKKDESKKEEPAPKAEVKKDEETKAEAKKDEPRKEEAKKDETKKEEPKKPEAVVDANAPPPGTAAAAAVVPKVEPKKNGIRDLEFSLSGLRNSPIRQVTVNGQTDKGATTWQLDTTGSPAWPLVIRRSGLESWARLYLEPPDGDGFQKDFTVAVVYEDGQSGNASIKVEQHTDPNLAVDPNGASSPRPDAWVHLANDEKLLGRLEAIGEESIRIVTPWGGGLDVPLARVAGFRLTPVDPKESPESFARRLKSRGAEDLLLARTKDGEVVSIAGVLEGLENDRLLFRYQGKTRKLPLELAEGLVMAARPEPSQPDEPRSTFSLPGGVAVTGRWKDLDTATWKVETPWGQELSLPAPEIQGVRSRGGRVTYLSDLNPARVEEAPFFGRKFSWRRDVGLLGEPLKMDGRTFERGVAVHSRSSLTYDLDGKYETLEALVGFDEASRGKGRVDCRVFADGKELYANPDLRADAPPVPLKLPLAGAQQLRLLVDFGRGQDTGDRVIWANARLYRK